MIAKFQIFAYNSRTVWFSFMKFWQHFETNKLYVCTTFRGNWSRDFGFRTRKPPRRFGVESGLSQKWLEYGKIYFTWLYVLRHPFIPTNPLVTAMSFFFLFFFFFLPKFVRSSSPKPQHIEIQFLCKVVELQTPFFLPKVFGATPPGTPPKMRPQKINFFKGSS